MIGGYDEGEDQGGCTFIWPSFISDGMQEFFENDQEWKDIVKNDNILYKAVNRSLDLTIERLGREDFAMNLERFQHAQSLVQTRCHTTVFPCDSNGRYHSPEETDCLWKDSACGNSCLDEVASELDLW